MGHARAMHFLGQYHENGWETARDIDKAFALYRQSAEGGDYRGECSWASVLTQQGRVDEAVVFLLRAIPKAPPHFLAALADQLATSPHASLRELLPRT
jgi:TPR repeat protein